VLRTLPLATMSLVFFYENKFGGALLLTELTARGFRPARRLPSAVVVSADTRTRAAKMIMHGLVVRSPTHLQRSRF
jgi:hypothetical protein